VETDLADFAEPMVFGAYLTFENRKDTFSPKKRMRVSLSLNLRREMK
jgi:hypothetical protein